MRLHSRMIKPGFWSKTELIRSLPVGGRLYYVGLVQLADDSGCLEDDTLAHKIHLFPADSSMSEETMQGWLDTLVELGKVIRYTAQGKACLYLRNFHKHQSIKNPSKPDVPLPPWVSFSPFPSNASAGKYAVSEDVLSEFLAGSYGDLETSSNLNLNLNQKVVVGAGAREGQDDDPDSYENLVFAVYGLPDETAANELAQLEGETSREVVAECLKAARDNATQNPKSYFRATMQGVIRQGVTDLDSYRRSQERFEAQKSRANGARAAPHRAGTSDASDRQLAAAIARAEARQKGVAAGGDG